MHFSEYKRIEKLENTHFWYRAMEDAILDIILQNIKGKIRILDAGCGNGGMSQKMEKFGQITAIDINDIALKFAKAKGLKKVIKASVEKLSFASDFFDLVVSLDVLYHKKVRDDLKALKEMYRVLKPKGLLLLRLPAFELLRGAHDVVVETRHRYTVGEVRDKMGEAGFAIEKLSYANMLLSIPLFIKRSYERLSQKNSLTSDTILLPDFINTVFYLILKNENKLLNFINLPFGSSIICLAYKK